MLEGTILHGAAHLNISLSKVTTVVVKAFIVQTNVKTGIPFLIADDISQFKFCWALSCSFSRIQFISIF